MSVAFRDGRGQVNLTKGEMFVVPRRVEHKPIAKNEAKVLLIEPRGVLNTGNQGGERTVENDTWI